MDKSGEPAHILSSKALVFRKRLGHEGRLQLPVTRCPDLHWFRSVCMTASGPAKLYNYEEGNALTLTRRENWTPDQLLMAATSEDIRFDEWARVVIPRKIREWAELSPGGDCIVVVQPNTIEVWEPRRYRQLMGVTIQTTAAEAAVHIH